MKRYISVLFMSVFVIALAGCGSVAKDLGEAGAFKPATCYDDNGRQWTGSAACAELARAEALVGSENAKAAFVAGIQPPTSDDPAAWDRYYDAVEDGPMKAAFASQSGGGANQQAAASNPQSDLARTAIVTSSNEKVAWIGAGAKLATGGIGSIENIVRAKFDYKRDKAMWAAFERPNVAVDGWGGGGDTIGGEGTTTSNGTYIVNVDGAVATDASRANSNRSGVQSTAYDDGAAIGSKKQITDPTFVNGVCDDSESVCDGASAPFVQQENPSQVDAGFNP